MHFHQRPSQVQADARAEVALFAPTGIEALEHPLFFLGGYAAPGVRYRQFEPFVCPRRAFGFLQFDGDGSAIGRKLESVREQVHDHLVEILRVHACRQFLHLMHEAEPDATVVRGSLEQVIKVLNEPHQFHLAIFQAELAFLYLAHVHQLVDEAKDALRVLIDERIIALVHLVAFVHLHQFHERPDNQRHRRANLMADVHEELDAGFVEFFPLTVLLDETLGPEMFPHLPPCHKAAQKQQQDVGTNGYGREIPRRMQHNGERLQAGRLAIGLGLHADVVSAGVHVDERDAVLAGLERGPRLAVDAVIIRHATVAGAHRGHLYGERTVVVGQVDFLGQWEPAVYDAVTSRAVAHVHRLAIDIKVHHAQIQLRRALGPLHLRRPEISQPVDAAKVEQVALRVGGVHAELVALQPVLEPIALEGGIGRTEAGQPLVRAYPDLSVGRHLYATDGVSRQPVVLGEYPHRSALAGETRQAERRTGPKRSLAVLLHRADDVFLQITSHGRQALGSDAEHLQPVGRADIQ